MTASPGGCGKSKSRSSRGLACRSIPQKALNQEQPTDIQGPRQLRLLQLLVKGLRGVRKGNGATSNIVRGIHPLQADVREFLPKSMCPSINVCISCVTSQSGLEVQYCPNSSLLNRSSFLVVKLKSRTLRHGVRKGTHVIKKISDPLDNEYGDGLRDFVIGLMGS